MSNIRRSYFKMFRQSAPHELSDDLDLAVIFLADPSSASMHAESLNALGLSYRVAGITLVPDSIQPPGEMTVTSAEVKNSRDKVKMKNGSVFFVERGRVTFENYMPVAIHALENGFIGGTPESSGSESFKVFVKENCPLTIKNRNNTTFETYPSGNLSKIVVDKVVFDKCNAPNLGSRDEFGGLVTFHPNGRVWEVYVGRNGAKVAIPYQPNSPIEVYPRSDLNFHENGQIGFLFLALDTELKDRNGKMHKVPAGSEVALDYQGALWHVCTGLDCGPVNDD